MTDQLTIHLEEAQKLRATIKALTAEQKRVDALIMETLFAAGQTGLKTDSGAWSIQNRTTRKLDKGRLVLAGVSPEQIEAGTVETVGAPFLLFKAAKGEDDSEG